jgi:RES domain-containing protein
VKLARGRSLARRPLVGTWYRALRPHHATTPLAGSHTATMPGRFNPGTIARPAFPVVYLAEDHLVALFEVSALLGSPLPGLTFLPTGHPWTVINADVQLARVADLCRASERRLIETTVQELTGDWRGYSLRAAVPPPGGANVPAQRLSAALYAVRGLEGFLTYSAKVPTHRNLVVFPDKLRVGSFIRYTDPTTGVVHSIP